MKSPARGGSQECPFAPQCAVCLVHAAMCPLANEALREKTEELELDGSVGLIHPGCG